MEIYKSGRDPKYCIASNRSSITVLWESHLLNSILSVFPESLTSQPKYDNDWSIRGAFSFCCYFLLNLLSFYL